MLFRTLKTICLKNKTTSTKAIQNAIKNTSNIRPIFKTASTAHILNRTFPQNCQLLQIRHSATNIEKKPLEVNPDPSLRVVRQLYSKPTKLCLLPESWFGFFHPKTGVSGFYTFMITFGTYLCSKEIYVMEHEFYCIPSMFLVCWGTVVYIGPGFAKYLDKEVDDFQKGWTDITVNQIKDTNDQIENEEYLQWSKEGELMLIVAKRENVILQLDYAFRKRLMTVYEDVKRRLDLQVALLLVEEKFWHKNMVQWINEHVLSAMTLDMDTKNFNECINNLKVLAEKYNTDGDKIKKP